MLLLKKLISLFEVQMMIKNAIIPSMETYAYPKDPYEAKYHVLI